MPILSSEAPVFTTIEQALQPVTQGVPVRASIGSPDVAFAWTEGLPSAVARAVRTVRVEGSGYYAVEATPTGSPGEVDQGAAKPTLATYATRSIPLKKYAGLASMTTEAGAVWTDALTSALVHVLTQQVVVGFDKDVIAELVANAGSTGTGSTWSAAVLDGIASVVDAGGNPDILIMSGSDYAAAVEAPGAGYMTSPKDSFATLFGLRIVLSVGAAAGEAFVADSSAITCGEGEGPIIVVDPYSGLETNAVRVAVEGFFSAHVSAPGAVAALTVA